MTRVVTRTFAGVAGLAIALTGTALPALAADAVPDISSRVSLSGAGSLAPTGIDATSAYFAGYEKDPDGALKSASAKTTVPEVDCSGAALKGVFQGIGNEQEEGIPTLLAGVFVVCDGSTPVYQLAALSGAVVNVSVDVRAGDDLTVSLNTRRGNITMKVVNTRTDEVITSKDAGVDTVAQYGSFPLFDSETGEKLPVPNFGKEVFSANKINGDQLADATKYVRKDGSTVQIDTGRLARGKFDLVYKNA